MPPCLAMAIAILCSVTVSIPALIERRYMMICEGDMKVIFEPNAEMIKAIQSIAPPKVIPSPII